MCREVLKKVKPIKKQLGAKLIEFELFMYVGYWNSMND